MTFTNVSSNEESETFNQPSSWNIVMADGDPSFFVFAAKDVSFLQVLMICVGLSLNFMTMPSYMVSEGIGSDVWGSRQVVIS